MIGIHWSATRRVTCALLFVSTASTAALDPVSVKAYAEAVDACASAAIKVKELFGGGKKDDSAILNGLDEVKAQNQATHRKLDQVLSILSDLRVIVSSAVRSELAIDNKESLLARINIVGSS